MDDARDLRRQVGAGEEGGLGQAAGGDEDVEAGQQVARDEARQEGHVVLAAGLGVVAELAHRRAVARHRRQQQQAAKVPGLLKAVLFQNEDTILASVDIDIGVGPRR